MDLIWKTLNNYSRYNISNNGDIYDLKLKKIINTQINQDGYKCVTLRSDINKRKTFRIHRLVGLLFVENTDNKSEINHKDGIKLNNNHLNLEWCTHSENIKHAWDNNLLKKDSEGRKNIKLFKEGQFSGNKNFNARKIVCINTNEIFETITAAAKFYNIDKTSISSVLIKRQKTAGKHPVTKERLKWKYYE